MSKSLEENIISLINKSSISIDESLDLLDSLYWADWDTLDNLDNGIVERILSYLKNDCLSYQEISKILKLYNNPEGAHISRFSNLILNIYKTNKKVFLKALNLEKEEAGNIVYIFRMNAIELDKDRELLDLIDSDDLNQEETDTAKVFLKMYENICNT